MSEGKHLVGHLRARRDQNRLTVGPVLRLGEQVGGAQRRVGSLVRHDQHLTRPRRQIDASRLGDERQADPIAPDEAGDAHGQRLKGQPDVHRPRHDLQHRVLGLQLLHFVQCRAVCRFARASNMLPTSTSEMMNSTASKYTSGETPLARKNRGAIVAAVEKRNAAPVPTAINVFMSAAWCRNADHARV